MINQPGSECLRLTHLAKQVFLPLAGAVAGEGIGHFRSKAGSRQCAGMLTIGQIGINTLSGGGNPAPQIQLPAGIEPAIGQIPGGFRRGQIMLAAAAAEVAVREVARYPSASLLGMVCLGCQLSEGINIDSRNWSFGINFNIPLFNAGELSAKQAAAMARYQQALASYQLQARQAVKEIEENLLRLDDSQRRTRQLERQLSDVRIQLKASKALYQAGSASQLQLAEMERYELAAQNRLLTLQQEQTANWIALYKALGGQPPAATQS